MQIKAILFDIGGTLVDSNDMHVSAWQDAFAGIGKPFDRQTIHDQIGKGTNMLVPTLLPDLDENERGKLGETQGEIFKRPFLDQAKAFPNARDLLVHVHERGQKVVLASSATKAQLDHYIELLDAQELIHTTTSSNDVEKTKPAPDIFAAALNKLEGISADEVWSSAIRRTTSKQRRDVIAAVAVRSGGFGDDTLREAGAVAICDHVAALLAEYENSPLGRAADASPQAPPHAQ